MFFLGIKSEFFNFRRVLRLEILWEWIIRRREKIKRKGKIMVYEEEEEDVILYE